MSDEFGFGHPDHAAFWGGAAVALGLIADRYGDDCWHRFMLLFGQIWRERLVESVR